MRMKTRDALSQIWINESLTSFYETFPNLIDLIIPFFTPRRRFNLKNNQHKVILLIFTFQDIFGYTSLISLFSFYLSFLSHFIIYHTNIFFIFFKVSIHFGCLKTFLQISIGFFIKKILLLSTNGYACAIVLCICISIKLPQFFR